MVNNLSLIYIYKVLDWNQVSNCYRYSDKVCVGDCPKLENIYVEAREGIMSDSKSVYFLKLLPSLLLGKASPREILGRVG